MTSGALHSGLRVVVAESAADGQDGRGTSLARALRDAGHEVVYTGLQQAPEQMVETAIQEDADLIGLSAHAGADLVPLLTALVSLLRAREVEDIEVFVVGGNQEDLAVLTTMGVAAVFAAATPTTEVTRWLAEHVAQEPAGR
ncbi:cobalamin-dependent protein [Nocardioides sp.]|uniref:cobalamin-dependent protein n=1 Tax=Nocardioides sp. TaxID=35761 RepID=UPI002CA730C1|nr:cobalamin-dependent protein [Nocardioides sp.]HXH77052.1 cobalamin-dependent protein [Nocardioides sp.]